MLVSIIVPIYNRGVKLEEHISYILNQTYKKIEIILINDGSTDNSLEICNKLSKQDARVKVIDTKNQGPGKARNVGINSSKGEYILFCDADDKLEYNAIEQLVKEVRKSKCDLVVFGYDCENRKANKSIKKEYNYKRIKANEVRKNYELYFNIDDDLAIQGAPWNKFFKSIKIKENDIEYPDLRRQEDEIFITRYMNYCDEVVFIENVLYTYYENDIELAWSKFPIDYFDIVKKVYEYRTELILPWNSKNKKIIEEINKSYLLGAIKSLELTYNKKKIHNIKDRLKLYEHIINDETLRMIVENEKMSEYTYQRIIAHMIRNRWNKINYIVIGIKVFIQRRCVRLFQILKNRYYKVE